MIFLTKRLHHSWIPLASGGMTTEHLRMGDQHPKQPAIDGALAVKRKIDEEFENVLHDQKYHRLTTLLAQTTLYSKFLADKLTQANAHGSQEPLGQQADGGTAPKVRPVKQPAMLTGLTLRDYQLSGVTWLVSLYENGLNGILADEMGLGKTIETIGFLAFLIEKGIKGPFLVVGPLSTISNWIAEIVRCCPTVPAVMYHGNPEQRAAIRKSQLQRPYQVSKELPYPIVVTSYEMVMIDRKYLGKFDWKYLVVDEGHRLKNLDCKLIKLLKSYRTQNRLLLTGTPLQNNLAELWSLLNFLLPQVFDDLDTFHKWFSELEESAIQDIEHDLGIVNTLHIILKPFLLRRLKTDVEGRIPHKKEFLVTASMTREQHAIYNELLTTGFIRTKKENDELSATRKGAKKRKSKSCEPEEEIVFSTTCFQNTLMQLRKVCNHPYLMEYPVDSNGDVVIDQRIVDCCGKMSMLDQLLRPLLSSGHKVLLFSQMTKMLDVIESYAEWKGFLYFRIDGHVSQQERAKQIQQFNSTGQSCVFLLSTRAGGLGINLTAADTVIIYDCDWNPQVDLQAQDRCHRIGQSKPVNVIRLATKDSVEVKMLQRAEEKRNLERIVIYREKFKTLLSQDLLMDDLEALLRQRQQQRLRGTGERQDGYVPKVSKLSREDLEVLLDRAPWPNDECNYHSEQVEILKTEPKVKF